MFAELFGGIFDSTASSVIEISDFFICLAVSLFLGAVIAGTYLYHNKCSKGFLLTLAVLPAVVCVVIMMVNGNIGTGVAVAGAFGLVRFRSAPGSAKEIASIFLSMGAGLIAGTGYVAYAIVFTLLLSAICLIYTRLGTVIGRSASLDRTMRITIPEDLDYDGAFSDLLKEYTVSYELVSVKTTNMGSLFRLTYDFRLKKPGSEKELIDKLRCRNGNLEITVSKQQIPEL